MAPPSSSSSSLIPTIHIISRILGWLYTLSWSLSFYPQPLLNISRRSVTGASIDFPTINLLGFICYLIWTSTLLYSPAIRAQYAARHPDAPDPTVRLNDFAFALHAVVLSGVTWSMFWPGVWGFRVGGRQKVSWSVAGVGVGGVLGVLVVAGVVVRSSGGGGDARRWAWIDVIYATSYLKLLITFIKYMPQVLLNYRRQSTEGWSIGQINLDMAGGVLSLAQLFIDSSLQSDWSGVTGNPVKFMLGNISIFFDVLFLGQHYWLYRRKGARVDGERQRERDPLLEDGEGASGEERER